jgi:pyruvate formate lyase activating enzyme
VLFDIKHMDSEAHRQYTSVPNDLILSNLSAIAGKVRVWLRIPLIAGFNDAEEHIDRVISLAGETGAEKISFLPYHEGGSSKCSQIGTAYSLPAAGAPDKEHLALLQGRVTDAGLQCGIGK